MCQLFQPPPYTMFGANVAKVIESRNKSFPVGSTVITNSGWVETGNINLTKKSDGLKVGDVRVAPDIKGLSPSHLLGACGMPGNTGKQFNFIPGTP